MKPYSQTPLKWHADAKFLIPVAIILAMVAWTIFRELTY